MTALDEPVTAAGTSTTGWIDEDPDALTFRVNREALRSQDVFDTERAEIWDHTWLYLGHESEIPEPGDYRTRTIGGRNLIFVRDAAGAVRAYFNSCPHRGTS